MVWVQLFPAIEPVRPEGYDHLAGRVARQAPDQGQRHVDVAPAVKDGENRMAPRPAFIKQAPSTKPSLSLLHYGPDGKLVEIAEMAVKLAQQILIPPATFLHEQQTDPFTVRFVRSTAA